MRNLAEKSLRRPPEVLMNTSTGRPAVVSRTGRIRGDDADSWLRDNDPSHHQPKNNRRRVVLPPTDAWLEMLVDANASTRGSVVYFVQRETGGPVKIGWSRSFRSAHQRLRELQVANPERLVIRRLVVGEIRIERMLHLRFASLNVNGEWFAVDDQLRRISRST